MSAPPQVIIHSGAGLLAKAAAARVVTGLVDVLASRGHASLVLTGGGIGTQILAEIAASPARDAVDWQRTDIWWGDERFVPAGDPDRNETGARAALLDHIEVDPGRVHAMPGPDGPDGNDPEAAAARYAGWLRAAAPQDGAPFPSFDILMLGIGPEGHVASLFPGLPAVHEQDRSVVAVHDSPKPPPVRLSLTFPAIQAAREVWVVASGEDKADGVAMALSGASQVQVPAAGAHGQQRTLFLVDQAAAAKVPGQFRHPR